MSITTIAGVRSGVDYERHFFKSMVGNSVAVRLNSAWARASSPGAGSYDSTLNGVTLDNTATGALPYVETPGADTYLASFNTRSSGSTYYAVMLCDRLWHNGGFTITSTSAQLITSPTWPARDQNASSNGDGVLVACEVSAGTGSGTPTLTLSYTNSDGTAGRTATNMIATAANAGVGFVYLFGLQAGDRGVRSVQSLTLSASWTSGTINLVAFRPLCVTVPALAGFNMPRPNRSDVLSLGMPRIINGSCLYLCNFNTAAGDVNGSYQTTAG